MAKTTRQRLWTLLGEKQHCINFRVKSHEDVIFVKEKKGGERIRKRKEIKEMFLTWQKNLDRKLLYYCKWHIKIWHCVVKSSIYYCVTFMYQLILKWASKYELFVCTYVSLNYIWILFGERNWKHTLSLSISEILLQGLS